MRLLADVGGGGGEGRQAGALSLGAPARRPACHADQYYPQSWKCFLHWLRDFVAAPDTSVGGGRPLLHACPLLHAPRPPPKPSACPTRYPNHQLHQSSRAHKSITILNSIRKRVKFSRARPSHMEGEGRGGGGKRERELEREGRVVVVVLEAGEAARGGRRAGGGHKL